MPEFTVRQYGPRAGQRGTIKTIEVQKPSHDKAVLLDKDTGQAIAEFYVDAQGSFNVHGIAGAPVQVPAGGPQGGVAAPQVTLPTIKKKSKGAKKNWRVENDLFFIRPTSKHPDETEIAIPIINQPGPYTPNDWVPEIVGQDQMLFTLALGIYLKKPCLLIGPTGIGKSTAIKWLAKQLNFNYIRMPITKGTESVHLIGEPRPMETSQGNFGLEWVDGPVPTAIRASQSHPTILNFDELNRIGNIAELARLYPLLDDDRLLELSEWRDPKTGQVEVLRSGDLFCYGTSNPTDDEGADYIGVQELDPALSSRFPLQPSLGYPPEEYEIAALCARVKGLDVGVAAKMVSAATRIRASANVRFPISFRELEAWALTIPFFGYREAAEIAVVTKCPEPYRDDLKNLLQLQG